MTVTTPVVFGAFGHILGGREEKVRAAGEQVQRLRDEFAAVIAHDLRDPIQAILLQIQSLERHGHEGLVPVPVATLGKLERGANRLARMVDDLLDATRIDVAHLRLIPEAVSLPEAVDTLIERIRPTLGSHTVETRTEGEPSPVLVDPTRLDQILTNLIENAAKYSNDEAPIVVTVRPDAGGSRVSVSDRGPGIAPDDMQRLFNRFYQAKRARENKSGLGLGLYITKGLVEAHGGRIEVRSELGRGSVFSVWLPSAGPP
jgi:signal transduction histidine kinase